MDEPIIVVRREPSVLSQHPKIALKVANFLADFSFLEFSLYAALAAILGDDGRATHIILGRFNSFTYKLDTVLDFARLNVDTSPIAKVVVDLEDDIRQITSWRNTLAHGIYVEIRGEDNIGVMINMFVAGRGGPHTYRLTEERLSEKRTMLDKVDKAIHDTGVAQLLLFPKKKGRH